MSAKPFWTMTFAAILLPLIPTSALASQNPPVTVAIDTNADLQHLADIGWSGDALNDTVPAQSITLYILPQ